MKYCKTITLKNGVECVIRNGDRNDGKGALDSFILTHAETDFLASLPDEISYTVNDESEMLEGKTNSEREIELVALVNGEIVGLGGLDAISKRKKMLHRVEFGVSVNRDFWNLGIGRALTEACIECARDAGYSQIELDVVSDNEKAISLYKSVGFVEYGRNPRGFLSPLSGWQELVLMRKEL